MNPHFPRARLKVSATDRLYLKPSMRCARTAKTMVSLCDRSWSPSGGGAAGAARRDPVGPPTAARRSNVSLGEPGSPTPPPAGGFGRATPSRRGMGKPGFPIPPPGGRVWEGYALPGTTFVSHCGCGPEARAPGPPPAGGFGRATPSRRGMGKPGYSMPPPAGGLGPHAGGWGNPVSPSPHPVGGSNTISDCRFWIADCRAWRHDER